MIISRTPFRISFFGGGTDFPTFFREFGGSTISTTINQYCYLSIHAISLLFKHRFRASYALTENVANPSEFQHPLLRETLLHMNQKQGLEIAHVSDLPGRTGLGSSSSFTVGLLNALYTVQNRDCSPEDLARQAILIERKRVGDPGGWQDQYAAAYGGFTRLNYRPDEQVEISRLPLTSMRLHQLRSNLLMFYTGNDRNATSISHDQETRTKANTQVLQEMSQMTDEAEKILLSQTDLKSFGALLHESWSRKKSLARGISNDIVNEAYDAARNAGTIGGKLLGAGGHGFLLLFAPPEAHPAIRQKLGHLQAVDFSFSNHGSQIIFQSTPGIHHDNNTH